MRACFLCVLLIGCKGCGAESSAEGEATGGEAPSAGDEAEGRAGQAAGPAPILRIAGAPDRDGQVQIVVENRGQAPARLRSALAIERDARPVEATIALRFSCDAEPPECVSLVPGAALHPPAWTGQLGDAQCDCERCTDAPAGSYRFVVTSCDGAHRARSEPFALGR